jgi:arylsulfatase A-like enzyme
VPGRPAGATGQDADKVARYRTYLQNAYRVASDAVEAIVQEVGVDRRGEPRSDVIVVSDHGMSAFHTAVNLRNLLLNAGFTNAELADVAIRTTGPAAHLYVNLQGRELGGTVDAAGYQALVERLEAALVGARDENDFFNPKGAPLFSHVWSRPMDCGFPGFCTDDNVGQDFGDVVGLMVEGYNFDGTQSPVVVRLGDSAAVPNPVLSVPNFYGAHGHDSELRSMSATFIAAGPGFRKRERIRRVESIDVAPTILALLGVEPAATVDGRVLCRVLDDRRQAGCRGAPDEDDERNGDHDGHVDD